MTSAPDRDIHGPARPGRAAPVRARAHARVEGRERGIVWSASVVAATTVAIVSVSGFAVTSLFHQYSSLKWALTVAAPVLIVLLLTVRRPSQWAVGLLVLSVPLAPYVMTVGTQPVSILVATAGLATVVVLVEGGLRRGQGGRSAIARTVPWILALLVVPTVVGGSLGHEFLYLALIVDIGWVCTRVADLYPDGRLLLVLILLGSAGGQAALALVQHATGRQYSLYGGAGTATFSSAHYFFNYGSAARTTGTFFDPISLGNVLALALPLALLVVIRTDVRRSQRWFAGCTGALLLGGLTVSLSRASWMGAAAGVAVVCVMSRGSQRHRAVVVSAALLVTALFVASTLYGPELTARFDSILHPTASTVKTAAGDRARQEAWSFAVTTFDSAPFTGVGIGKLAGQYEEHVVGSDSSTHASDVYLQYLAEAGLLGGAVLVLLAGGVASDLFRARRSDPLVPGLTGAFVSVAVTWVTDYTVRYYAVAGCFALLLGLAASARRPPEPSGGARTRPPGATVPA